VTLESRVFLNFAGIVFAKIGITLFVRATKHEWFPSVEGAPSLDTDPIICR